MVSGAITPVSKMTPKPIQVVDLKEDELGEEANAKLGSEDEGTTEGSKTGED